MKKKWKIVIAIVLFVILAALVIIEKKHPEGGKLLIQSLTERG